MKPILFNTEMVQAILQGRKTVTRRVIKPQPKTDSTVTFFSTFDYVDISYDGVLKLSPYQPGDILYVRETWANPYKTGYKYKADYYDEHDIVPNDIIFNSISVSANMIKWKPSIHMPKEAARIFLRVTNVSVAKLQDITEEQAKAEGAEYFEGIFTAIDDFKTIWDNTLRKENDYVQYGWFANPWVWVIEFERIAKEDAI